MYVCMYTFIYNYTQVPVALVGHPLHLMGTRCPCWTPAALLGQGCRSPFPGICFPSPVQKEKLGYIGQIGK